MVRYSIMSLLLLLSSLIAVSLSSYAQGGQAEINTLKGLKGIGVSIGDIDPDATADGLNTSKLLTEVTKKLKESGINVYTDVELPTIAGQPILLVNINTSKQPGPIYIFSLTLDLNQIVLLSRNNGLTAVSPTWSVLTTGGALPEDLMKNVQAALSPMLDSFIADYNKANTK